MTRPPIIAPCDICQLPDTPHPKGVWFAQFEQHPCASCGTHALEYDAVQDDLMTQLLPVLEQWAACWLACGVERGTLWGLASLMGFDEHMPDMLKTPTDSRSLQAA